MSEYPWNEKNNTFTYLSSLYNPFKNTNVSCRGNEFFSVWINGFMKCNIAKMNTRNWTKKEKEKRPGKFN